LLGTAAVLQQSIEDVLERMKTYRLYEARRPKNVVLIPPLGPPHPGLQRPHGERLGPLDGQPQGAGPYALHSAQTMGLTSSDGFTHFETAAAQLVRCICRAMCDSTHQPSTWPQPHLAPAPTWTHPHLAPPPPGPTPTWPHPHLAPPPPGSAPRVRGTRRRAPCRSPPPSCLWGQGDVGVRGCGCADTMVTDRRR
jgi:hypothetical protein